jgi:hypothetical protein
MAGRGGAGRGRGANNGRGDSTSGRAGRGGRGGTHRVRTTKTGLTKELEGHIFDLGEQSSANLMRTTQIKIAQYIGSLYGGDIMGELETKTEFVAPTPTYPQSALNRKVGYEAMIRAQQNNELANLRRKLQRIQSQAAATDPNDHDAIEALEENEAETNNKILRADYDLNAEIDLPLSKEEKGEWRQEQKACGKRGTKHLLNQQKALGIIVGQCTQRLQDKLHDEAQWEVVNRNKKPLELYALIERVVMQQTGDEYPASNLVDNLLAVLMMKQNTNQSNTQWYEKLNTRVDVAESVGVEFTNFTSLWAYCCDARGLGDYATLTPDEILQIQIDSKERLLGYLLIANSSSTANHESIKNNLLEAFIAKRDEYPTTRSDAIALLNKYDEKKPPPTGTSEGTAFAQKGKAKNKKKEANTRSASFAAKLAMALRAAPIRRRITMMVTTHQYLPNRVRWKS